MLQLNTNRKAYIGSLIIVYLHFTLMTLKDQCPGQPDLEVLYLMSF